jgi:hypothetical protein
MCRREVRGRVKMQEWGQGDVCVENEVSGRGTARLGSVREG